MHRSKLSLFSLFNNNKLLLRKENNRVLLHLASIHTQSATCDILNVHSKRQKHTHMLMSHMSCERERPRARQGKRKLISHFYTELRGATKLRCIAAPASAADSLISHISILTHDHWVLREMKHMHTHNCYAIWASERAPCALLLLLFVYTSVTGRGGAQESDNEEILSLTGTGTQEDKVKRASPSAVDDWFPFLVRFTELMHQLKYTHAWCSHPSIGAVSDSHKCSSVCVA
jgi:hypothetical protein